MTAGKIVPMKTTFLAAGALVVALAVPLGAYAQQTQPQGAMAQQQTTPSPAKIQHRWMKRLGNLNLSGDQQQRIHSMINQYSQTHPQGSPRDRDAARELQRQIISVLSSDQQSQYRTEMRARHQQMQQRRGQMPQQDQGPQGQGPQDQGPQYQGPQGQGPQDQGPQYQGPQGQGPPPDQGPPANQQPPA
jgi:Spy/CpxP family protein refolding chaperone